MSHARHYASSAVQKCIAHHPTILFEGLLRTPNGGLWAAKFAMQQDLDNSFVVRAAELACMEWLCDGEGGIDGIMAVINPPSLVPACLARGTCKDLLEVYLSAQSKRRAERALELYVAAKDNDCYLLAVLLQRDAILPNGCLQDSIASLAIHLAQTGRLQSGLYERVLMELPDSARDALEDDAYVDDGDTVTHNVAPGIYVVTEVRWGKRLDEEASEIATAHEVICAPPYPHDEETSFAELNV